MHKQASRILQFVLACLAACLAFWSCGSSNDAGGGGGGGGGGGSRAAYAGVEVCAGCHTDLTEHWEATAHAEAVATLTRIGQGQNANCLRCHTTGMGEDGGFVDATQTPHLQNVQCESCHGPGAEHAGNPSADNIDRVIPSSVCGECHTQAHHPTFDEWTESKHSVSLEDAHSENCVQCHTGEGFINFLERPLPPAEERQIAEHATTNVECWTCHNPHQTNPAAPGQLRLPVNELCRKCHTFRLDQGNNPSSELERRAIHNPQGELLNAGGGYSWDGDTWQPLALPAGHGPTHAEATGGECNRCHVWTVELDEPTNETPNVTGHTFRPNLNACAQAGCHSNLSRQDAPPELTGDAITEGAPEEVIAYWQANRNEGLAKIAEVRAALNQVDLDALNPAQFRGYLTAKWNLDLANADKSETIHNKQYLMLILDTSLDICAQLPQKVD